MAKKQIQPPSGGCVLKPTLITGLRACNGPAAFGRLCVETQHAICCRQKRRFQPPSGGCVLKQNTLESRKNSIDTSRLRAAVC